MAIHEFGHFWVARRCGVKVLKFSIGFGKAIKTWVGRDGVEYIIAPIPLGGYVKMLGQEDSTVADTSGLSASQRECSFACKPLWQKTAIVAAGAREFLAGDIRILADKYILWSFRHCAGSEQRNRRFYCGDSGAESWR